MPKGTLVDARTADEGIRECGVGELVGELDGVGVGIVVMDFGGVLCDEDARQRFDAVRQVVRVGEQVDFW